MHDPESNRGLPQNLEEELLQAHSMYSQVHLSPLLSSDLDRRIYSKRMPGQSSKMTTQAQIIPAAAWMYRAQRLSWNHWCYRDATAAKLVFILTRCRNTTRRSNTSQFPLIFPFVLPLDINSRGPRKIDRMCSTDRLLHLVVD
jgi:hypothetical protein